MIITSDQLRDELGQIWPELQFILLSDSSWWSPSLQEVKQFLEDSAVDRLPYVEGIHECEEFALQLVAERRHQRGQQAIAGNIPKNQLLNWPLGFVVGTRFRGRDMDHWCNICRTRQGIVLIEPQDDSIWQPAQSMDQIYFLFM